ncbi:hypothetical protein [Streptomyces sp. NPDC051776]
MEQRVAEAARELGIDHTEDVRHPGRAAWNKIRGNQDDCTATGT